MSSSGARFTIQGSPSNPRGYDASSGEVLTLALEQNPPSDVSTVQFSCVGTHPGGTFPTFSNGGAMGPPTSIPVTGSVTCTLPGGPGSYIIRCETNGGALVDGSPFVNTFDRLVAVRTTNLGLRLLIFGESTEYAGQAWTEEVNNAFIDLDGVTMIQSQPFQVTKSFSEAVPTGVTNQWVLPLGIVTGAIAVSVCIGTLTATPGNHSASQFLIGEASTPSSGPLCGVATTPLSGMEIGSIFAAFGGSSSTPCAVIEANAAAALVAAPGGTGITALLTIKHGVTNSLNYLFTSTEGTPSGAASFLVSWSPASIGAAIVGI